MSPTVSFDQVPQSVVAARRKSRAPAASEAALIAPADVPQMIANGLALPAGTSSEIARATPATRNLLLLLVILPFWTSLLLRVYAWIGLLKANGVINNVLLWVGLIHEPLTMLYTPFAMYVGIVYSYLPFFILPLYANLEKMDWQLLEAAEDLGCRPWQAFYKITLPLSRNGILAGSMLVFIPAVGEFVIPALLGGPNALMIGRVLWDEFFSNRAWPVASAVAILLLILLVPFMMWYQSVQARETAGAR